MLVWHIDFVPDIWNMNICNVGKQYVDIVEADNDASAYSIEGDPFPGSANITAFTDDTKPSMRTWNNEKLYAPITEIKEQNGIISFMFKGGKDIFDQVVANEPTEIKAGSFTASWNKVDAATGYLLTVYKVNEDGSKSVVTNYDKAEVGNVDNFKVTGLTPLTNYAYELYATNGRFYSKASNLVTLKTLDPTINVYTLQLGTPFEDKVDFANNTLPDNWTTDSKTFDSRAAYSVTAPSLKLGDKQYLQSPVYKQDVRGLSFWYRGNTANREQHRYLRTG